MMNSCMCNTMLINETLEIKDLFVFKKICSKDANLKGVGKEKQCDGNTYHAVVLS